MKPLRVVATACVTLFSLTGPSIHAQSQPININVVVEDKLGHPVRGLQEQDFTVLDNGQPAKLTGFHAIDASAGGEMTRIVVLIDMINSDFGVVAREREQLGEFLKEDGGHLGYPTSLGALTESGLKMMNNSSTDGQALLASFEKFQTDLRTVGRGAGFYGAAERLQMSLQQLGQMIAYEGTQPGRKMVVVISPGWLLLPYAGEYEDNKARSATYNSIVEVTNGLRQAQITLYSLDPFELGRTDPFYYQNYLKGVSKVSQAEYPYLALQVLAEHSGGRAITAGHDIKGELNTAMHDAGSYYQLSFDAPAPEHPGEYHELHVKIAKPDLTARTSASYYDQPAGGNATSPAK